MFLFQSEYIPHQPNRFFLQFDIAGIFLFEELQNRRNNVCFCDINKTTDYLPFFENIINNQINPNLSNEEEFEMIIVFCLLRRIFNLDFEYRTILQNVLTLLENATENQYYLAEFNDGIMERKLIINFIQNKNQTESFDFLYLCYQQINHNLLMEMGNIINNKKPFTKTEQFLIKSLALQWICDIIFDKILINYFN